MSELLEDRRLRVKRDGNHGERMLETCNF